jgi:hypothetical protein
MTRRAFTFQATNNYIGLTLKLANEILNTYVEDAGEQQVAQSRAGVPVG